MNSHGLSDFTLSDFTQGSMILHFLRIHYDSCDFTSPPQLRWMWHQPYITQLVGRHTDNHAAIV